MKYIAGLGNPGDKYRFTRHNIGFMAVEKAAELIKNEMGQVQTTTNNRGGNCLKNFFFSKFRRKKTELWRRHENMLLCDVKDDLCLVKPLTYMNLSGEVFGFLQGVEPENVLIVVDEIYLPLGRMRFRSSGSSGGHNGLKSVEASLGTDCYNRLKVGVGAWRQNDSDDASGAAGDLIEFVLGKFEEDERDLLAGVTDTAAAAIYDWYQYGIADVQQKYNGIDLRI